MHIAIVSLVVLIGASDGDCCEEGTCRSDRQLRRPCGPMPQSCYNPRYGCYGSNNRWMHRYPAFHGTFYRAPYNYRNVFDYPWQAGLHEPTSMFSFNVPGRETADDLDALPEPIEIQPTEPMTPAVPQTVPDSEPDAVLPPLDVSPPPFEVSPPMSSAPSSDTRAVSFPRIRSLFR